MIASKVFCLIFFLTFVLISFTQSQKNFKSYKSSIPIENSAASNLESFIKYRNVNSPNEISWNEGLTACVRFNFKKLQGICASSKIGNNGSSSFPLCLLI